MHSLVIFLVAIILVGGPTVGSTTPPSRDGEFFYVSLFDQDFPILVEFELVHWSDSGLEFSAPAPISQLRTEKFLAMPNIARLLVGMTNNNHERMLDEEKIVSRSQCGGLTVEEIALAISAGGDRVVQQRVFRLTGDNVFLALFDNDKVRWEQMLRKFLTVNSIDRCEYLDIS